MTVSCLEEGPSFSNLCRGAVMGSVVGYSGETDDSQSGENIQGNK